MLVLFFVLVKTGGINLDLLNRIIASYIIFLLKVLTMKKLLALGKSTMFAQYKYLEICNSIIQSVIS